MSFANVLFLTEKQNSQKCGGFLPATYTIASAFSLFYQLKFLCIKCSKHRLESLKEVNK